MSSKLEKIGSTNIRCCKERPTMFKPQSEPQFEPQSEPQSKPQSEAPADMAALIAPVRARHNHRHRAGPAALLPLLRKAIAAETGAHVVKQAHGRCLMRPGGGERRRGGRRIGCMAETLADGSGRAFESPSRAPSRARCPVRGRSDRPGSEWPPIPMKKPRPVLRPGHRSSDGDEGISGPAGQNGKSSSHGATPPPQARHGPGSCRQVTGLPDPADAGPGRRHRHPSPGGRAPRR